MPELNHKFTLGKMNKDADERLVQNGEYRDALNAQVTTSDGSDVGTLQNLLGNLDVSDSSINFNANGSPAIDFEYYCVGSITDGKNDRIYWMLAGVGKDIVAEYDYNTKTVSPVVVDMYNPNIVAGVESGRVLNFDKNFLITGINIVEDFLFWTDNNTEPKQLNIQRAKMGCVNPVSLLPDFNYQTDLYVKTRKADNQVPPFINTGVMKEEHITVIKKSPRIAPRLEMKNTLRGDNDSDNVYGNLQTTITIPDPVTTLQDPDFVWHTTPFMVQTDTLVDYQTGDFLTLTLNNPIGGVFSSDQELSDIVVQITSQIEYNYNYIYHTSAYDPGVAPLSPLHQSDLTDPNELYIGGVNVPATGLWFQVEIVSGNLRIDPNTTDFSVELRQEQALFKFKFPRFASRYKYTDGQYSTFSPFSEVAFLPSEFDYLPKEGYNLGMVNSVRKLAVKDFVDKNQIPDDVVEIDILYKESNSPIVYTVDTIKRVDITTGVHDSWNGVDATTTSTKNTTGFINISSEIVHAMLPSNQMLRAWDNVPRKALAQEIVGNRIVYANYLQNYDMKNSDTLVAEALIPLGGGSIARLQKNTNITVDARLKHSASSLEGKNMVPELLNPFYANEHYLPAKSIKSLRTYQVGVSYIDEFGRETPVFSSARNGKSSLQVNKSVANQAGKLKAQIWSTPPEWAKNYKFLIKESSNEYYNLAMDRWYPAQDGNIWLSFPSAERNKVDEETFLILKKRHKDDGFVSDNTKYKILAIENEAPIYIKTKRVPKKTIFDGVTGVGLTTRIVGDQPAFSNTSGSGYPTPDGTTIRLHKDAVVGLTAAIDKEGIGNWEFRVRHAVGGTSNWYKIQSYEKDPLSDYINLISKKMFGVDMGVSGALPWLPPSTAAELAAFLNIQVEFVKKEVKDLPEFDGRFFVKVLADSTIKKAIIGITPEASTEWMVTDAIRSQYINPQATYTEYSPTKYHDLSTQPLLHKFFEATDVNHISVEEMFFNDENGMEHAVHDTMVKGGKHYWERAGNTPLAASQSSGWFIDKIEAFRPWKITGGMGWNYNPSNPGGSRDDMYNTNQDTAYWQATDFFIKSGKTGNGFKKQLKVIGTGTHTAGGNNYLNQNKLKAPIESDGVTPMLRNRSSNAYGGIIPSVGIDKTDSIIHLSYAGTGDHSGSVALTTLSQLKTHFGDASWANSYTDEISFINNITTPGALWRWQEDPDGIIYRTTGYDPLMTTLTNLEWNANTTDPVDNVLGVSLYNYTQFCDYIVRHKKRYYEWLPIFGKTQIGPALNRAHYVSVGRADEEYYGLGAGLVFINDSSAVGRALHAWDDVFNISTTNAGGWNGQGEHFAYPSFTREWNAARNRRRRYMFAAKPYIDGMGKPVDDSASGQVSTLGNVRNNDGSQTGNYLPTNNPDNPPHFDYATSTPLKSIVGYQDKIDTTVPRPLTDAPGIRPDGVYSGYTNGIGLIPPIKSIDMTTNIPSESPGSCTFQIITPFIDTDDSDEFSTTNPAIWETEPKADLDLDLYYEVGQIYPIELNKSTMEQFAGPIREYNTLLPHKNFNTKVKCFKPGTPILPTPSWVSLDSGATYTATHPAAIIDPLLIGNSIPGSDDIRVVSHAVPIAANGTAGSDRHVWLEDVNGIPVTGDDNALLLYPNQIAPSTGDWLRFVREDGSMTESSITAQAEILGPVINTTTGLQDDPVLHNAYELDINSHNYEVALPWYNCYSFGNGVESNRIRDDYNQVYIDKGAKVSTVLEEPYLEDRRSSGLIYSGIYNSISNVNNLNQFIQAEKITKDLNPDGGTIQKLYTRDTNLVTLCEDKVFQILASKDALYNADGNPQLVATDKVLGEATTFAGDYGISTNPESFAVDSFRMYFADRIRGAVLRLSQNGLTPISSIGMTDWFNDNLVGTKRLIGSYDEKKEEYNLNLGYFDYSTYSVDILCAARTSVSFSGVSSVSYLPVAPGILILNGLDASKFNVGDVVNGEGIPLGAVITNVEYKGGGVWWLKLSQTPDISDLWPLLPLGRTSPYQYGLSAQNKFTFPTRITASVETQPSSTLSFSEKNKGWVSFKSFLKEGGLSLNNEYFTFKNGMLHQHHANPIHNNFYGEQFDSSVEVLFNDIPGSVKSFGTLNYEGSQSHITQDLQNSGEYWDNKNKLGWYVSEMHTNLQQGDLHEFKDKEGKWFSQIKGVTTKWLDDGMSGNIDTNEFSYQGIDDNDGVTIIDGGYTSWDCNPSTVTCVNCDSNNPTLCTSPTGQPFTGSSGGSMMEADIRWFWDDPTRHNYSWLNWTFTGGSYNANSVLPFYHPPGNNTTAKVDTVQGVIDYWQTYSNNNGLGLSFPAGISLEDFLLELYSTNLGNGGTPNGYIYGLPVIRTAAFNAANPGFSGELGSMDFNIFSGETINFCFSSQVQTGYNCTEIQGLGGVYADENACLTDTRSACGNLCSYKMSMIANYTAATSANCSDGSVYVTLPTLDQTASHWNVDYTAVNVPNVAQGTVFTDHTNYSFLGDSDNFTLTGGQWRATITDSNGCYTSDLFKIECAPPTPLCSNSVNMVINVLDADSSLSGCPGTIDNGEIIVAPNSLSLGASTWSVEYFININGILTSIHIDDNGGSNFLIGGVSTLPGVGGGDYAVIVTDNLGCSSDVSVSVGCVSTPTCIIEPYTISNLVINNPTNALCNNGALSLVIQGLDPSYQANGMALPNTFTVDFNALSGPNAGALISTVTTSSLPQVVFESGLSGESYSLTITDNNGCSDTMSYALTCVAPTPSWDCVNGNCIDPGTGNGTYSTLSACQLGCAPTPVICGGSPISGSGNNGAYNVEVDLGSTTGAVIVEFNVISIPDKCTWSYDGQSSSKYSSHHWGYMQGVIGKLAAANSCNSVTMSTGGPAQSNVDEYVYDPVSGFYLDNSNATIGPFASGQYPYPDGVSGGVTLVNDTSNSAFIATMVVPKPNVNSGMLSLRIEGPCSNTSWKAQVFCPVKLPGYPAGTVSSGCLNYSTTMYIASPSFYGGTPGSAYAQANYIPQKHDWVFWDEDAVNKVPEGIYPIQSAAGLDYVIKVANSVIELVTMCTPGAF